MRASTRLSATEGPAAAASGWRGRGAPGGGGERRGEGEVEDADARLRRRVVARRQRRRAGGGVAGAALDQHEAVLLAAHEAGRDHLAGGRRRALVRRLAFGLAAAEDVGADLGRIDMAELGATEIRDRELAEDVVEDRGRVLDALVAL